MTAAVAYRSNAAPAAGRATSQRSSTSPVRASNGNTARPKLRVLDQAAIRRRARRRNAAIVLFMVLLSGLFVVAYVHAHLVATQQELDQTRSQIAELRNERARLERAVDEASSPALIVEHASELGMVRAADPVFLIAVEPTGGDRVSDVDAVASSPLDPEALVDRSPVDAPASDARSGTALGASGDG